MEELVGEGRSTVLIIDEFSSSSLDMIEQDEEESKLCITFCLPDRYSHIGSDTYNRERIGHFYDQETPVRQEQLDR